MSSPHKPSGPSLIKWVAAQYIQRTAKRMVVIRAAVRSHVRLCDKMSAAASPGGSTSSLIAGCRGMHGLYQPLAFIERAASENNADGRSTGMLPKAVLESAFHSC